MKLYLEKIDKNVEDLKIIIESLREKIEQIQINYFDADEVNEIKETLEKRIEKLEENRSNESISERKIYLVSAGIGAVCITIMKILDEFKIF